MTEAPGQSTSTVPARIPADLVVDFDIRTDPLFRDDPQAGLKTLQDGPPLFFTPRNGGHWVVVDPDMLFEIFHDPERFSSYPHAIPHANAGPYRVIPIESDPPEHQKYRRLIDQIFSPRNVAAIAGGVRLLTNELIDAVQARGECEFVADVAEPLPVFTFLRLLDFPRSDMPDFRAWAQVLFHSADANDRATAHAALSGYLKDKIQDRRRRPAGDVISRLLEGEIDGRPITDEEGLAMATVVFAGGLDTVVGTLSFITRFLAFNPNHRRRLVEEPALIPAAMEELMRRHCIASVARTAAVDFGFHGVSVKKGDAFWCSTVMLGMDDSKAANALEVDFDRRAPHNPIFGTGIHICPGRHLARLEIATFYTEWLRRIPEFQVEDDAVFGVYTGSSMGLTALPLRWSAPTGDACG